MDPAQNFTPGLTTTPPPAPSRSLSFESPDRARRFVIAADAAEKAALLADELYALARRSQPATVISLSPGERIYRSARPEVQAAFQAGLLRALQVRASFLSGFLRFDSLREVVSELRAFHRDRPSEGLTLLWDDPLDLLPATEHVAWSRVRLQELLEESGSLALRTRVFTVRRATPVQRQIAEELASAFCDRGVMDRELHAQA